MKDLEELEDVYDSLKGLISLRRESLIDNCFSEELEFFKNLGRARRYW